jgi:hypothetical protein
MSWSWKVFSGIFLAGAILVTLGFAISWFPQSIITELQNNLRNGNLPQNERWAMQGSLSWWQLAQTQTYATLSSIVNVLGILIVVLSVTYSFFSIWNDSRQRRFQNKTDSDNEPCEPEEKLENNLAKRGEVKQSFLASTNTLQYKVDIPEKREVPPPPLVYNETGKAFEVPRIDEKPTALWYLAPFFFGLIGGLVGYIGTKDQDKDMAGNLLFFGFVWSIFLGVCYAIINWFLIASLF